MPDWEGRGVDGHPELEMLSAYVDGTLGDQERASVEAHVASCDECQELVSEVLHVMTDDARAAGAVPEEAPATPVPAEPARVLPFTRRRWVWAAAGLGAAAVLVLSINVGWLELNQGRDDAFDRLIAATGDSRSIEARLAGFPYGRLEPVTRSGRSGENLALLAAAGELQQRAENDPSAENLRRYGVALTLLDRHDEAIAALERSLTEERSARTLSDLSAAYLDRATRTGDGGSLSRALNHARDSVNVDSQLVEARFNLGLALEKLGMFRQAEAAYREVLRLENDPRWRAEIEGRLKTLQKQVSELYRPFRPAAIETSSELDVVVQRGPPSQLREQLEVTLPAAWGRAVLRGDAVGAHAAWSLFESGAKVWARRGDLLPFEAAGTI
jgi:tetratricopeptide (TPR) repeat protein